MCLTNNRHSAPVIHFSDTILGGFEVKNPKTGVIEHVCLYSNNVQGSTASASAAPSGRRSIGFSMASADADDNLRSKSAPRRKFGYNVLVPTGNAMLLALPAKAGTINLIPVGKRPNIARDYQHAVTPPAPVSRGGLRRGGKGIDSAPVVIKAFDGGVYDVIIAGKASQISSVLDQVDEDKRPIVNEALYKQLDELYGSDFQFLLYCFSETNDQRTGCAAVAYQPHDKWKHLMFIPGLDGHNGEVETGDVDVDHTIVLGSHRMGEGAGKSVKFTDAVSGPIEEIAYFPSRVIGTTLKGRMPQGDFVFSLSDLKGAQPEFIGKRELPPMWSKTGNPAREDFYFGDKGVGL